MRKAEQKAINKEIRDYVAKLNTEITEIRKIGKLRTCNAVVYETSHFYILRSYSTTVACIDKENDVLVDFLRAVYGYTATSAQHIAKFSDDYSKLKNGCSTVLRYYDV